MDVLSLESPTSSRRRYRRRYRGSRPSSSLRNSSSKASTSSTAPAPPSPDPRRDATSEARSSNFSSGGGDGAATFTDDDASDAGSECTSDVTNGLDDAAGDSAACASAWRWWKYCGRRPPRSASSARAGGARARGACRPTAPRCRGRGPPSRGSRRRRGRAAAARCRPASARIRERTDSARPGCSHGSIVLGRRHEPARGRVVERVEQRPADLPSVSAAAADGAASTAAPRRLGLGPTARPYALLDERVLSLTRLGDDAAASFRVEVAEAASAGGGGGGGGGAQASICARSGPDDRQEAAAMSRSLSAELAEPEKCKRSSCTPSPSPLRLLRSRVAHNSPPHASSAERYTSTTFVAHSILHPRPLRPTSTSPSATPTSHHHRSPCTAANATTAPPKSSARSSLTRASTRSSTRPPRSTRSPQPSPAASPIKPIAVASLLPSRARSRALQLVSAAPPYGRLPGCPSSPVELSAGRPRPRLRGGARRRASAALAAAGAAFALTNALFEDQLGVRLRVQTVVVHDGPPTDAERRADGGLGHAELRALRRPQRERPRRDGGARRRERRARPERVGGLGGGADPRRVAPAHRLLPAARPRRPRDGGTVCAPAARSLDTGRAARADADGGDLGRVRVAGSGHCADVTAHSTLHRRLGRVPGEHGGVVRLADAVAHRRQLRTTSAPSTPRTAAG